MDEELGPPTSSAQATHGSDKNCVCDDCALPAPPPILSNPMPKKKKRYIPPKVDANTFPTQQAFLDSLKPIPLEEVESNNRRCITCWKWYGEAADPGHDNSELPVKLRCGHVFGNKCLAITFGLPKTSRVNLQAFHFTPTSKSTMLAQRLHSFALQHQKHSLDHVEIFANMLEESNQLRQGEKLFGSHWWSVIQELQHPGRHLADITLLENAVILHMKASTTGKKTIPPSIWTPPSGLPQQTTNSIHQSFCEAALAASSSSSSTDSFLTLPQTLPQMIPVPQYHDTALAPHWDSGMADFGSLAPTELSSTSSNYYAALLTGSSPNLAQSAPPQTLSSPSFTQQSTTEPDSATQTTWEKVLDKETNLDKLTALHKKAVASVVDSNTATEVSLQVKKEQVLKEQATKEQALLEKAVLEQVDHMKRLQDGHERRRRNLIILLSKKLATVYDQWLNYPDLYEPDDSAQETCSQFVHTAITVHKQDSSSKTFQIPSSAIMTAATVEEDDETVEEPDINKMTFIITRMVCQACCKASQGTTSSVVIPESIWWRADTKIPDDCAICHKILYKKDGPKSSRVSAMEWDYASSSE